MTFLDAYALVALLTDEPAAEEVQQLLRDGSTAITVINLAETVDVCQRVYQLPPATVRSGLALVVGTVACIDVPSETDAWQAAELRLRYYARRGRELSIADCFLLAAAGPGDAVATSDPAVAKVARSEDIRLIALPDRAGKRP